MPKDLREQKIDEKLIYIPKVTPSVDYNYWLKSLDTTGLKPICHNSIKVATIFTKVCMGKAFKLILESIDNQNVIQYQQIQSI